MKEQSFLKWAQRHALVEAYHFYYISVPPWQTGLQEIEIWLWWQSALESEAKIKLRLTGFFDEWLKQGQLEKVKTQTLSVSEADEWRRVLFQSDFWKYPSQAAKDSNWHQGEQTEMEGWKIKPDQSSDYRKFFFQPLEPHGSLYPLQLKFFQWVEAQK